MIEQLNPRSRSDAFGSKLDRAPSPILAVAVPWATILIGSLAPFLPVISPAPILPPFGFLFMIAWRLMRPGLLPLWAGLPLGLFDDLFSGQPLGSATLLFSLTLIAIELVEARFPWRSFWQDWLTASILITAYLATAALISGAELTLLQLQVIGPQLLLSIIVFPIIGRMTALLDRLRLMRVRRLG
jgi:rod shape-determining protein MreD